MNWKRNYSRYRWGDPKLYRISNGTDGTLIPEQKYRDVLKLLTVMTDGMAAYCILGIENQSDIQLAHQVSEAALSHKKELKEHTNENVSSDEFLSGFWKTDKLLPVVINIMTGSKLKYPEAKERVDMCLAIEEMRKESELRGELKGELKGELRGEIKGIVRTYRKFGVSLESTMQQIIDDFDISEDEAEMYVKKYWE